jgi:hypothetical protein
MLGQQLLVDAGFVVEAFQMSLAGQVEEVAVTGAVGGQKHQVVGALVQLGLLLVHAAWPDVELGANEGFDAGFLAAGVEVDSRVHAAMVSDSQGVHVQFFGAGNELVDAAQSVQQAELGMNVKMGEVYGH